MVEYLYDAIRVVAGVDNDITAYITDEFENLITENCSFVLHDRTGEEMLLTKIGTYDSEDMLWHFLLAPEETRDMRGRYMYCIQHNGSNLCFKQPIYFE